MAFLVVLAVFGLGVWLGGPVGATLLCLLAAALGVLLATTWSRLAPTERAVRVVVLLVLLAVALQRWS